MTLEQKKYGKVALVFFSLFIYINLIQILQQHGSTWLKFSLVKFSYS
jgi:hypothetical protein